MMFECDVVESPSVSVEIASESACSLNLYVLRLTEVK